ncbi:MAG: HEAT repeat domain-containing protein [Elusimicrobia bacterium]|nr:HEAT repeat domain-containing protein [Elusimicrobiota bacterium]
MFARSLLLIALLAAPAVSQPDALKDPYQDALNRLKSREAMVRRQAAGQIGEMRRPEAAPALLPLLDDDNAMVRCAAEDSLGLLRAGSAVGKISQLLLKDKDASVRQTAATALAYIGDPSAADALIAAVGDSESGVRFSVVRTIGVMRLTKAAPALLAALKDPDPAMRRAAAAALGQIQSKDAVNDLRAALKDPDETVRLEVLRALGSAADPAAVPELSAALTDKGVSERLQAAMAFARVGSSSGTAVAMAALKENNPAFRQQAAGILALVGDAKTGLSALNAAHAAEKDPQTKSVLDFSRVQLKARLGLREEPAASMEVRSSPAAAKAMGKGGKGSKPTTAPQKKTGAAAKKITKPAPKPMAAPARNPK